MLARKKSNEEMVEELDPFLESESEKFVTWMMKLYSKLVGMTPNANKPAYLPKTTEKKRIESTDDEKGNLTEKSILEFFSGPLDFKGRAESNNVFGRMTHSTYAFPLSE